MLDEEFKLRVIEDLSIIKTKVHNLERNRISCEKGSIKKDISINTRMIYGIYGLVGSIIVATLATGVLIK